MKIIFLAVLLFVALSTAKVCQSTGDPHYKTFAGQKYDLYGAEGDYILAKAGDFEVQTRIEFGRFWGKQGINTAVAVRYRKSFFELYADYYEINNKKNASFDTAGGLTIAYDSAKKSYTLSTPSGERVIIDRGDACSRTGGDETKPCISFNVYVTGNDSIEYDGLCKGICSDPNVAQQWRLESTSKTNLFHVKLLREKYVSPWTPPTWKDEATKKKVTDFCKSLNLPEDVYKDCIIDGMIYSGIPVGYRRYKDSVARANKKCIQFAQKARKHCTKWATQKATQTKCVKRGKVAKKSCKTTKVCVLKKVCVTKRGNKVVKKTSKCAKYKKVKTCNKGNQSKCVKRIKRTFNVKKCKKYGNKVYRVCTKWA